MATDNERQLDPPLDAADLAAFRSALRYVIEREVQHMAKQVALAVARELYARLVVAEAAAATKQPLPDGEKVTLQ